MLRLTKPEGWSDRYGRRFWRNRTYKPAHYLDKLVAHAIDQCIRSQSGTMIEVGCGDSLWLSYVNLAHQWQVTGADYSELGCEMARTTMSRLGAEGNVIQADVFSPKIDSLDRHKLVFSLGFVEHFFPPELAVNGIKQFLEPGGIMLTIVPNMGSSFHGLISRLYSPSNFDAHVSFTLESLSQSHKNAGLEVEKCDYLGLCSLGIVAWGCESRLGILDPIVSIPMRAINFVLNRLMMFVPSSWRGGAFFSPYLMCISRLPA